MHESVQTELTRKVGHGRHHEAKCRNSFSIAYPVFLNAAPIQGLCNIITCRGCLSVEQVFDRFGIFHGVLK